MHDYKRKTKEVTIEGIQVVMASRTADAVYAVIEYMKEKEKEDMDLAEVYANGLYIDATIVSDSLSYWISQKWFFKRWILKRKYSAKKLIKTLSPEVIGKLSNVVTIDLEGGEAETDEKKKKEPAETKS